MAKPKNLDRFVTVRVTTSVHKKFHTKASRLGRPSDVLREIVEAFIEDRLTVIPSPTKRNLYHVD